MNGRIDLEIIGGYRTHADSMQIVSDCLDLPKVFCKAPPSNQVKEKMSHYLIWFNQAFNEQMPKVIHAGIAHLYFELIHPFEDGNGRIGRAIAERALAIGTRHYTVRRLHPGIDHRFPIDFENWAAVANGHRRSDFIKLFS